MEDQVASRHEEQVGEDKLRRNEAMQDLEGTLPPMKVEKTQAVTTRSICLSPQSACGLEQRNPRTHSSFVGEGGALRLLSVQG